VDGGAWEGMTGMAVRYDGGKKTWIRKTRGTMNNEYR